jgi:plastocyanin
MTPRLACVSVLLLLASACSGNSSTVSSPPSDAPTETVTETPAATDAAGSGATLTIKGFHYSALQVAPGTTITVKNMDEAEHTVTSDTKGLFDVDDIGSDPKTFTAPTKPGTYNFHCTYHATMHGSVTVTVT